MSVDNDYKYLADDDDEQANCSFTEQIESDGHLYDFKVIVIGRCTNVLDDLVLTGSSKCFACSNTRVRCRCARANHRRFWPTSKSYVHLYFRSNTHESVCNAVDGSDQGKRGWIRKMCRGSVLGQVCERCRQAHPASVTPTHTYVHWPCPMRVLS
jgi:hypothetical protein